LPNLPENEAVKDTDVSIVLIPLTAMRKMKKEELGDELAIRDVSSAGLNKAAGFNLLRDSLLLSVDPAKEAGISKKVKPLTGFPITADWKELKREEQTVQEPTNQFKSARAPTVPEDESSQVPVKYNFGCGCKSGGGLSTYGVWEYSLLTATFATRRTMLITALPRGIF